LGVKGVTGEKTGKGVPARAPYLGPVVLQPPNYCLQKFGAYTRLAVHGFQAENHVTVEGGWGG
jgi:hypothetical protein